MIELVVSMAISSLLMVGLAGSLSIAAKNQSQSDGQFAATFKNASVPQQMVEDLELATSIVSNTATAIEFEVPDRNGDGYPEKVKYSWTGASGSNAQKIQWTYKNQTPVDIATGVSSFNLTYSLGTRILDQLDNKRALLKACDAHSSATNNYATVSSIVRCSQFFLPTLPLGTATWNFGGFRFLARKHAGVTVAASDKLTIEIRSANTDRTPTSIVLASMNVNINRLTSDFDWVIVQPKMIRRLASTTGLCLVIYSTSSSGLVDIAIQEGNSTLFSNTMSCNSSNSGSSWSSPTDTKCGRFYAYGGYPDYISSRQFLMSTNIDITSTSNGSTLTSSTRARMLNTPEM
jgi:hypothetical protein